jgi:hypothetical protein
MGASLLAGREPRDVFKNMGIWDDPWIAAATERRGSEFCTTLPPPPVVLPDGLRFRCLADGVGLQWDSWLALVRTTWSAEEAAGRLTGAWVAVLEEGEGEGARLVGTCVLRPRGGSRWVLETLRGKGYGSLLMRSVCSWIYERAGPFVLLFTWELRLPVLVVAWWRGWLRAAAAIEYGWMWSDASAGCGFCPVVELGPRWSRPVLLRDTQGWAVVNDSGQRDGWGYVAAWGGVVDWAAIAKQGGWRRLWMRAPTCPDGGEWRWSGEFVVVGSLNAGSPVDVRWVTAEVA